MPLLRQGDHVWVKDILERGTVVSNAGTPRSYNVETPRGTLRRNRYHLSPTPIAPATRTDLPEDGASTAVNPPVTPDDPCDSGQQTPVKEGPVPSRVRVPPVYLKDYDCT